MKNILTVFRRELGAYFNSAIAYIFLIVFIVINNVLFMTRFFIYGKAEMRPYFDLLPLILSVFIPAIAMRLWAEDKRENTFELLMTFPMRPRELVLGKFFSSLTFYLLSLLSTVTIPIMLFMTGRPDPGGIIGGYLGAVMMGGLFLAIGIFISGMTSEQIVAFVLAALSCFLLYLVGTDYIASFFDGWIAGLGSFLKNHLGAASHTVSFGKGVIDLKDIAYFAALSSVFLFLNGLSFEGRLRPKAKLVFSAAVMVCLAGVIMFNWILRDMPIGRFDITENKIYTVSAASKKILKNLKTPVFVKLYITPVEKMPTAFKTLEQEISGKLDELRIISNDKFVYKVFHIEAARLIEQSQKTGDDSAAAGDSLEKTLQEKGIVPFQVESIDRDELGVKLVYAALSIAYKEKAEEILPRILPQNIADLEYLLFSRIVKLNFDKKPKIALFSPLKKSQDITPEMSRLLSGMGEKAVQYEDEYKSIALLMRNNGYEVERTALTKDDPLDPDLSTLLVVDPDALSERQIYEIRKFLYRGGAVFAAAQGFDYAFQMAPPRGVEISASKLSLDVNKLTQGWGVKVNEEILMDENSQMISVTTGQNAGPFALSMPIKVPNQIVIKDAQINKNASITNRLPSLFYLWGSSLDVADDLIKQLGLKKTVLFTSGPRSWKTAYSSGFLKKESLVFPKANAGGNFTLGVMLEGQFGDSFLKEPPPGWSAQDPAEGAPQKDGPLEPKPGKVVLIGCSKMFNDQLITSPGNLGLFANIVDGLTLGDEIIQIRSKTPVSRDLKSVSDARKIFFRFFTIFLVPVLLVIFAAARLFIRKKEKQFYLLAQ